MANLDDEPMWAADRVVALTPAGTTMAADTTMAAAAANITRRLHHLLHTDTKITPSPPPSWLPTPPHYHHIIITAATTTTATPTNIIATRGCLHPSSKLHQQPSPLRLQSLGHHQHHLAATITSQPPPSHLHYPATSQPIPTQPLPLFFKLDGYIFVKKLIIN
uniref:Uncharacterized protein n=1 Tax=Tanacetum cinerariifolium TaxID=118510 RepID=A0A6L2MQK9_TANCI|nr:hypothetical protein [Tanacetum cinerariifolium]